MYCVNSLARSFYSCLSCLSLSPIVLGRTTLIILRNRRALRRVDLISHFRYCAACCNIDMSAFVTGALDILRGYAGSIAWAPLVEVSRGAVLSLLRRIEKGQLLVKDNEGSALSCGRVQIANGATEPRTELTVVREAFWVRVALFADMVSLRRLDLS